MPIDKCGECDGSLVGIEYREVIRDILGLHETCWQGMSAPRLARLMGFTTLVRKVEEDESFYLVDERDGDGWVFYQGHWWCLADGWSIESAANDHSTYDGFDSWESVVADYGISTDEDTYCLVDGEGFGWVFTENHWYCIETPDDDEPVHWECAGGKTSYFKGLDSWQEVAEFGGGIAA